MSQLLFRSSIGIEFDISSVVREILRYMREDPRREYKIIIGTDSMGFHNKMADFVTAIVVHRVGNGGRYFWRRIELGKFYTLRDRIIREVLLSLEIAETLLKEIEKTEHTFPIPKWTFEIHADVGVNGPTNVLIQEIVGMIRASNYEVKTKPESFAASHVADMYT